MFLKIILLTQLYPFYDFQAHFYAVDASLGLRPRNSAYRLFQRPSKNFNFVDAKFSRKSNPAGNFQEKKVIPEFFSGKLIKFSATIYLSFSKFSRTTLSIALKCIIQIEFPQPSLTQLSNALLTFHFSKFPPTPLMYL